VLAGCDQPRPRCSIARGEFSAIYTLRSPATGGPCEALHGELLSVQAYTAARSASDKRPDYDKTSIAIQPSALTALLTNASGRADANAEDLPYALGPFAKSEPADDDFCSVPMLNSARVRLPALVEQLEQCGAIPAEPAVDVSYAFRNVRVYTTAGAYGTQFAADLTYTVGDCTAEYGVSAVYPAVSCEAAPPEPPMDEAPMMGDLDGGAALIDAQLEAPPEPVDAGCPEAEAPAPPPTMDESLCDPVANPAQGRALGSGINPDFAVQCDPDLLLCVLKGAPPSLR
jgi:hypothetical protein